MRVMDVVSEGKAAMRVSEVFGMPHEKNGITVIPAARIAGDATRLNVTDQLVAIAALLTVRVIVKARARRA